MTINEFLDYYANLLIIQYRGDTKADATIRVLTRIAAGLIFNVALEIPNKYNIDTATGAQLDLLGTIIGIPRDLNIGYNTPDETYRYFLKFKIIRNVSTTGTNKMENNIYNAFNGDIIIVNNYDMTIDYILMKGVDELTKQVILANQNLLPTPTGVGLKIIFNIDTEKIYGLANNNGTVPTYIVGLSDNEYPLQEATVLDNENIYRNINKKEKVNGKRKARK